MAYYPVSRMERLRKHADIMSMTGNSAEIGTGHRPSIILEV